MRTFLPLFQLLILFSTWGSAHPFDVSPFILAIDGEPLPANNDTSHPSTDNISPLELFKRQNCAAGYYYCSTIVTTAVCCTNNAFCSVDNAGNAACCPAGSFCTGSIPIQPNGPATATATATPPGADNTFIASAGPTGGGIITLTATSTVPITVVAATDFTTALGPAASYVSNAYNFPFPYIAASFPNSADCAAAYSSCATEYDVCTSDLGGGAAYGVTIQAPGGGTTVAGQTVTVAAASLGPASAASVCSSLSGVACPGIAGGCGVFGAGTAATGTAAVPGSGAGRAISDLRWSLWVVGVVGLAVSVGCVL